MERATNPEDHQTGLQKPVTGQKDHQVQIVLKTIHQKDTVATVLRRQVAASLTKNAKVVINRPAVLPVQAATDAHPAASHTVADLQMLVMTDQKEALVVVNHLATENHSHHAINLIAAE
jgi:hypothetical protein